MKNQSIKSPNVYKLPEAESFINIRYLIFTVSVPPPEGENEEERDRTETRGPLPSGPQITEHQARAALLAHVADRCCWGSGAAKKMAIAKINYDSAFQSMKASY